MPKNKDIRYVFVHGLSGWGSYDKVNRIVPYWGLFGGDLLKYLNKQGFSCYAASVSPEGSAWDRACELYAQIAGTVVDYGKAHSTRCGHGRYGRDYSKVPLFPGWSEGGKIVLLGHSFGGATIRLFSEILANGSAEEKSVSQGGDLSAFFQGGQGDRIHSIVTLAAPTNGTTAYDLYEDQSFDLETIKISRWDDFWGDFFSRRKTNAPDGRSQEDYAAYDMHIDNALALNERISTLPSVYYFAVPCSATQPFGTLGKHRPVRNIMEPMFIRSSIRMGNYTGSTAGGVLLDASWQENDGLVNTSSAKAPMNSPQKLYDPQNVQSGIWQVMPVFHGDHMALQGGMLRRRNIRPFYRELLSILDRCGISSLPSNGEITRDKL